MNDMTTTHTQQARIVSYAIRTSLGDCVAQVFDKMCHGTCASALLPYEAHGYLNTHCAPIPHEPARSKHRRFARRMDLFGLEAALEAAQKANVEGGPRLGVFVGYGGLRAHWDEMMPSLTHQRADHKALWQRGLRAFHPFWMLRHLSNNAHALCAQSLDARGDGLTLAGANAGAQAIQSAIRALNTHRIDTAIVFAYDSLIQPDVLVELNARGAITTSQTATPYSNDARGLLPSEAAAALVLQRAEDTTGYLISASAQADGQPIMPDMNTLRRTITSLPTQTPQLVDGASLGQPDIDKKERDLIDDLYPNANLCSITAHLGFVGAAQSVLQAIFLTQMMHTQNTPRWPYPSPAQSSPDHIRCGLGLSMFAPGLTGAIMVRDESNKN